MQDNKNGDQSLAESNQDRDQDEGNMNNGIIWGTDKPGDTKKQIIKQNAGSTAKTTTEAEKG